jgi:hypothetical protein
MIGIEELKLLYIAPNKLGTVLNIHQNAPGLFPLIMILPSQIVLSPFNGHNLVLIFLFGA